MGKKVGKAALSDDAAKAFCSYCLGAYEVWQTCTTLFSKETIARFQRSKDSRVFHAIVTSLIRDFLLHILRLHDPVVMSGRINLTLRYIIQFGGWDPQTNGELNRLEEKLGGLYSLIKPARHRILAHNDLEAYMKGEPLGAFPEGMDGEYFEHLKAFVNCVHVGCFGEKFEFPEFAREDAKALIDRLTLQGII